MSLGPIIPMEHLEWVIKDAFTPEEAVAIICRLWEAREDPTVMWTDKPVFGKNTEAR